MGEEELEEVVVIVITVVVSRPLEKVVEVLVSTGGGAVIGTLLWGLRRAEFSEVLSLFRAQGGDCPAGKIEMTGNFFSDIE